MGMVIIAEGYPIASYSTTIRFIEHVHMIELTILPRFTLGLALLYQKDRVTSAWS